MAVATLIGYMIDEFEMLISRKAPGNDTATGESVGAAQALGMVFHDNEMELASGSSSPSGSGESTPTTLTCGANCSNSNSHKRNTTTDPCSS